MKRVAGPGILVSILLGACSGPPGESPRAGAADTAYVAEIESWRATRLRNLRSEIGWLSIVGLHWLERGENAFGSHPENPVPLSDPSLPPRAGVIRVMSDRTITVEAEPGVALSVADTAVAHRAFRLGDDGASDRFRVGRVHFAVLERGGRFAVRVWDPESPLRRTFAGIPNWPVDPAYRVEGRLVADDPMGRIEVPNIMGYTDTSLTPGRVTFVLGGEAVALRPLVESPVDSNLFFIFEDATTGKETYGGGRFLYADLEPGGKVTLDFNKAYNPPCALNPNTTCPLPPEGNRIPFAVTAGEKALPDAH